MLVTKLALKRREKNVVIKFNPVIQLAKGLYFMSMPNGLPQAQSQGAL